MRKTTSKIHFEVKKSKMQNRIIYGSLLSDGCDVYSRVCLCLENTGQEVTLLMRLPWEGALETPLDFPPGGMRYFCNLKNQFGECWVFGWGEALILLPVGGVAFRGAHLAGSPGGGKGESGATGWCSGVSSSSGSGGPGVGREGLSRACSTGSVSKGGAGGSKGQGSGRLDDMAGLHVTPQGHRGQTKGPRRLSREPLGTTQLLLSDRHRTEAQDGEGTSLRPHKAIPGHLPPSLDWREF